VATAQTARSPWSWAWLFGWLSVSGPALLLVGNIPTQWGPPLIPWVSILLDVWSVVAVVCGIAAVGFGRDDTRRPQGVRPRFAIQGLTLGVLGLGASVVLLLLWLLSPLSF
jgi:hypothetical protein